MSVDLWFAIDFVDKLFEIVNQNDYSMQFYASSLEAALW